MSQRNSSRYSIVEQADSDDGSTARTLVEVTGSREAEAVAQALRALEHRVQVVRIDTPEPLVGSGALR